MTDEFSKMFKAMVESGQNMARAFNPALETFQVKGFETLWPTMPKDMMEMWFGNTFNREGLDAKTRLLVTIEGILVLHSVGLRDVCDTALRDAADRSTPSGCILPGPEPGPGGSEILGGPDFSDSVRIV